MKGVKLISGIAFGVAMLLIVVLIIGEQLSIGIRIKLSFLSLGLGLLGIVLNLFMINESKHSIAFSLFYWVASGFLLVGIWMMVVNSPFLNAKYILFVGIALMVLTYFIPKERKIKKKDSDLLDDF
ncbi:MAG: hypothetical protein M9916_07815 [Crocinitomicaceae bacterium]|nr:hypothetical protein [Crocinitomicaceae bacterium]